MREDGNRGWKISWGKGEREVVIEGRDDEEKNMDTGGGEDGFEPSSVHIEIDSPSNIRQWSNIVKSNNIPGHAGADTESGGADADARDALLKRRESIRMKAEEQAQKRQKSKKQSRPKEKKEKRKQARKKQKGRLKKSEL